MTDHTERADDEQVWTAERIAALGPVTDITTTAAILRLSRSTAYELAKQGRFPVPVIRAGTRYRVPVALLLAALGIEAPRPSGHDLTPGEQPSMNHDGQSAAPPRTTADPLWRDIGHE